MSDDLEAYVHRNGLTFAEALRRAIRLLLKAGDGSEANAALGNIEQRIVTELSQHRDRQSEEHEDIRRLICQALGLD
ncbi:MAG: hypothetical protein NXI30_15800 [bacterium]|nr:hypothetical protein [bacterium]